MIWLIGLFTAVLIIDCLLLTLLVLVQLPKKEAGLGMAFGGGATDALFGAGSGNALTKMTKYAAAVFFVMTLLLSVLNAQHAKSKKTRFQKTLEAVPVAQPPAQVVPTNQTIPAAPLTNSLLNATNAVATNAPSTPSTNAPTTPPNAPPAGTPAAPPQATSGTPNPPATAPAAPGTSNPTAPEAPTPAPKP